MMDLLDLACIFKLSSDISLDFNITEQTKEKLFSTIKKALHSYKSGKLHEALHSLVKLKALVIEEISPEKFSPEFALQFMADKDVWDYVDQATSRHLNKYDSDAIKYIFEELEHYYKNNMILSDELMMKEEEVNERSVDRVAS